MSLTDEELTFKNNKSHIFSDPRANHYCFKNIAKFSQCLLL